MLPPNALIRAYGPGLGACFIYALVALSCSPNSDPNVGEPNVSRQGGRHSRLFAQTADPLPNGLATATVAAPSANPTFVSPTTATAPGEISPIAIARATAAADEFRLAFGSCNKQFLPQPLWKVIQATDPHAWLWLGDIVYADSADDISVIQKAYEKLGANPDYQAFTRNRLVFGTWDDHDFGENNAGKDYKLKRQTQAALLDFLKEPADSPRRRQEGIYTIQDLDGGQIRVFVLDTRYERDTPHKNATPLGEDIGDILGEKQWAWFERELANSRARVHVIASSIEVLPDDHHSERWAELPVARSRLLKLLAQYSRATTVIVSGDRHFAELSLMKEGKTTYVELTSSGLTHSWHGGKNEPNRYRVGQPYTGLNFGLLTLKARPPRLTIQVRGRQNEVELHYELPVAPPVSAAPASK
ncbi:MAG: alkaline phosphatase D family protein [Polyangiaceae bacterium]|nr:alkaline phosphatase D family protein [Polyangiaceae bacterium]